MNQKEFIIKMLPLVMRVDKRLQVHTYVEVKKIWKHIENKCAMCQAIKILTENK